ncbi:T9SS sorting signal type C domain-containing protein [Flavobacterium lacus]|uniref:Fibronectin type-III domain-containing protein n=1 Tax=Flavobacterium lacus TaxID=1353778 RepID=A0A328WQZ2_9FLAO|nr:T9SS sorting signal type C domain-containing protein [Flavobacterium lacus]RAR47506.1 hypothetical protein B0I10_1082 [Flavobacterium lacus]
MKKLQLNFKIPFLLLCFFLALKSSAQCDQPTSVVVDIITSNGATLSWNASTSAPGEGYQFEIRTSGAPGSGLTGLVDGGTATDDVFSSSISGLLAETSYFAYVRYQCNITPLYSDWTIGVAFNTEELPAPVAGAPAGVSDTFFTARWIGVNGATGYRIDVSTTSDFSAILPEYDNIFVASPSTTKLIVGLAPSTDYYYRIRAEGNSSSGPVTSVNSNVIMVSTTSEPTLVAVWTINGWLENIEPTIEYDVILDYHFVSDENNTTLQEAKSLTLNEGYTFTLVSGRFLIVADNIINNSTPNSFVVQSNANLNQLDDLAPANVGGITVRRFSSAIFRLDYTMWSSPVTGTQTLKEFSPSTVSNRFYDYDTSSDVFSLIDPLTTVFSPGSGYLIRARNNHVENNGTNSPAEWLGNFVGVPNNGEISIPLNTGGQGYNLVGNPYPSIISAELFIEENISNIEPALHFWRRTNNFTGEGDTGSFYAVYNPFGGTAPSESSEEPNSFIQVGQGFLVQAVTSELNFNNSMKVQDNFENQFFRSSNLNQIEKHRVWLSLTNNNGVFSQLLVGYAEGAINDKDRFDARYINDSNVALTSLINNEEFSIQAKALPFTVEDTIPLGFKIVEAGEYTISVNKMDGLFEAGQLVYLEDTFTSTIHNLSATDYVFSSESGDFKNRFVLRFTDETMSIDQPLNANAVAVFVRDNSIHINTGNSEMESVIIYDVQGRKLFTQEQVNTSEFTINTLAKTNQVLILQIKDQNNNLISKKVVF